MKKVIKKKKVIRRQQKHEKLPSMQIVNIKLWVSEPNISKFYFHLSLSIMTSSEEPDEILQEPFQTGLDKQKKIRVKM